jgi:hypothetical protein
MNKDFCRLVSDALKGQDTWEERARLRVWVTAILGSVSLVILLGLAMFAKDAYGQESVYKPTKIETLYKAAILLGGFKEFCSTRDGGCPMPAVVVAPLPEGIAGQFTWHSPGFISVTTGDIMPGTLDFNETVVHEFVHYLQWLRGDLGPSVTCEQVSASETSAYKAGSDYLAHYGVKKDLTFIEFMLATMCLYG